LPYPKIAKGKSEARATASDLPGRCLGEKPTAVLSPGQPFPRTDPFTAFEAVDSMISNQTAARLVGAPL
jgi:hypothetical protein